MDRQTFSNLVCAIYDGAIDPNLWPQTLGLICRTFGFRKGTVDLNRVPGMVNLLNYHHGINDQQAATMVSQYGAMPEVWGGLAAAMTRPIDRPWVVSRIMTQEALRRTDYYRNWVAPMGLVDGAAIVLARDTSLFGGIRLATDAQRGIIDDGLIDALSLLLPHCQRAARISGLLEASRTTTRNFQTVIDAISVPIILLSVECAIVHANPRAKVLLGEGLVLASDKGRLSSLVPKLQQAISHAIRRLALDETNIPGGGAGLSIRATDGSPRTLHLLPLAQGAMRVNLAGDAVAAIFISSASVQEDLAREALKSMFELTQTELAVFERILVGKSTQKIAIELEIAPSTVRTHVMHLFQKTDTHSRADLVRLAHGLEQPVAR